LLPKYLIDELAGASRPQQLALWVGLIVFGNVFWTLMDRTCARAMQLHQQRLLLGVDKALSEKIMSVPYRFLEDPYYLDLRERARFAMQNQNSVSNLITSAANALTQLITLLTLTAVMLQLSWVLLAILAATVCVMLLIRPALHAIRWRFLTAFCR
jgi:ATP-binding cassette subfamily B protein/ATP-binding cassette subfamily C protein